MDISDLAVRLVLLFFPGLICVYLVEALTVHREREAHDFLLRAVVLGVCCYLTIEILYLLWEGVIWVFGYTPTVKVTFFSALATRKVPLQWGEILFAGVTAVPFSLLVARGINRRWLHQIARRFGVSNKFGDLDVWGFLWNSPQVRGDTWIQVRDPARDLVILGRVHAFSDTAADAQLLIQPARVYRNSTSIFLYEVDVLYLARPKDDLLVEILPQPQPLTEESADGRE